MEVRFCKLSEVGQLQDFIHREWSAEHIFVHSQVLLNYQHLDIVKDRYNFAVAVDDAGQFQAVLGFIPPEHFEADDNTIWLALWKTAESCKEKSIGLFLLRFIENAFPHHAINIVGISKHARLIYKALRFDILPLKHYYATTNSEYLGHIALGLIPFDGIYQQEQSELLEGVHSHLKEPSSAKYRKRSSDYFAAKYMRHPSYQYFCLYNEADDFTIVYRVIQMEKGNVMRIIDCGGNLRAFPKMAAALRQRAKDANADYIDMLAYWADDTPVLRAGFKAVSDEIVPNYFEPFLQKNITIECATKGRNIRNLVVMKGDGDQDRPSRLKGVNA